MCMVCMMLAQYQAEQKNKQKSIPAEVHRPYYAKDPLEKIQAVSANFTGTKNTTSFFNGSDDDWDW